MRRVETSNVLPFNEDADMEDAEVVLPISEEKKVLFVFKSVMVPVEAVRVLPFMVE